MDGGSSGPIRVVVVDDHPMVREGLRSMLTAEGVTVVGEAGSGADALRVVTDASPDVILLDLRLPDGDGLAFLPRLSAVAPGVRVLVVTMHDEPALLRRAALVGASGYVLKGIGRRELLAAVQAVRHGASVVDRSVLWALAAGKASTTASRLPEPLTPVERDLLRLVAEGLTNRQISERLRWSVGTTKKYLGRVLAKLGAADRTQAAAEAARLGLLGER